MRQVFQLMIVKLFILIGILLIGGCAGTPQERAVTPEPVKEPKLGIIELGPVKTEEEPKKSIDPKVLYLLLTAELAGQKGRFDIALDGYLQAAKLVNDPKIAERAAKIALFRKDYGRANEAVSIWLKNDADNLVARKVAAILALRKEDEAAAVEHLSFLIKSDPAGFESALFDIIKNLNGEHKEELVFDVLDTVSLNNPEQASIPFTQALMAMQLNKTDVALERVQRALELQPDWNKALMFQAQVAANSGNLQQAEDIVLDAVSKQPENSKLKILLAQIFIKATKYDEAAKTYQQIIESNPDDAESKYALALLYIQLEQDEKARKLFISLLDKGMWQDRVSLHLGRIEIRKGDHDRALIWFDKVTSGPFVFEASISSIGLLVDQKKLDEAGVRLEKLKAESPEQEFRLILLRAELLNERKQYAQAFDLLTEALTKTPGQKELLYTRALIAERLDRLDVLEEDLTTILKSHPNDASALNALGYTLADRTDRLEEAEKYLSRAIELQPDEAVIIDSYGWLLFRQGKLEQSLAYLERAFAKEKEAEIAGHVVEVLWSLNRKSEAKDIFFDAIEKDPDDEYLLRLKQEIDGLVKD